VRIKLLVKPHESRSHVESFEGTYCTIGRKNTNVIVDDKRCSDQQILLFQGPDGRLWAEDLESANGCEVNGSKFSRTVLQIGDEVRTGKTRVIVLNFESTKIGEIKKGFTAKSVRNGGSLRKDSQKPAEYMDEEAAAMRVAIASLRKA
jgi:pSer/pThr/pTyr-binding forkhead associated (FHA) protein